MQADTVCLEDAYDKPICYSVDSNDEVFCMPTIPYPTTLRSDKKTIKSKDAADSAKHQTIPSIKQQIQAYIGQYRLKITIMVMSCIFL